MMQLFKLGKPLALLYAPAFAEKVEVIKALSAEKESGIDPRLIFLQIETAHPNSLETQAYEAEPKLNPAPNQTGSLFFTSGTSGVQKGVVHTYGALLASARERIGTWKLTGNDVVLNQKPGNWMGGIFGIIPSLISGARL
jgi:malonyl-CoA/methylmalonyl-CoA synthetase